jgi:hypothetical protein
VLAVLSDCMATFPSRGSHCTDCFGRCTRGQCAFYSSRDSGY